MSLTEYAGNDEAVFYVNEKGDDFTFFVACDGKDTVIRKLIKTSDQSDDSRSEVFRVAERVLVKNLLMTREILKPTEEFWDCVGSDRRKRYAFLRKQLRAHNKLKTELTTKSGRKKLLDSIATILNDAVQQRDLAISNWIEKELPKPHQELVDSLKDNGTKTRWRNRLLLERTFSDLIVPHQAGRGLICRSYMGDYLSVTFRKISDQDGYYASGYSDKSENRLTHLFSLSEYCQLLYQQVFEKTSSTQHAQGLLVITGSTKSAKSEITRGLIDLYLTKKDRSNRNHHLVTFEDPVERFFARKPPPKEPFPWVADAPAAMDYTPRQKGNDAGGLAEALMDALRQTPAIFFVGETREETEWQVLLNFAATGHLIVTTAHAGSLVEAMHKIFDAVKVKTAADRNEVASKLLGVIHLRSHDLSFHTKPLKQTNTLFPALWRRTPRGIAGLTSDGLASLLPARPASEGPATNGTHNSQADVPSCLGRRWLVQELFQNANGQLNVFSKIKENSLRNRAFAKATEWDLRGV